MRQILTRDSTLSGPLADRWLNAFTARTAIEADWTPSARAADRAIDVFAHQLTLPGTPGVAWTSDRNPTDPDGPRTPTVVAIRPSPVRHPDTAHVDLHVRLPASHGAGFSWFRYGDTDLDTLRTIAPLHPAHVQQHGGVFDRVATESHTRHSPHRAAELLADVLHDHLPGHDRDELAAQTHRAMTGAASTASRPAARQWLIGALCPEARHVIAEPANAEQLEPLLDDTTEITRTRLGPLNATLHAIRADPTISPDRTPALSR